MTDAYIYDAVRTPRGKGRKDGSLHEVTPVRLAVTALQAVRDRNKLDTHLVDDIVLGCVMPIGEQGADIARTASVMAGYAESVSGVQINRFCASGLEATNMAAAQVMSGQSQATIGGGVESMSRVPMTGFNPMPNPALHEKNPAAYMAMGDTAENVARKWQISRADQDAFALKSQQKAAKAQAEGRLKDEIVSIRTNGKSVDVDGCIRTEAKPEDFAGLKPAFDENGTVTAGTSSPLTDGASAVLVCTEAYAEKHGLTPLARLRGVAVAGCAPEIMGIGPVAATRKALARSNIQVGDLDVVELNEAFASQALACISELGLREDTINLDGGAIAIGHPLGATGARIVGKAAALLQREGGRYALATQCIGGGQGIATVLERI